MEERLRLHCYWQRRRHDMAQVFVKATIVPKRFKLFLTDASIVRATIGALQGTSDIGWLGGGNFLLAGTGANACLLSASSSSTTQVPIDPPVIYTFCNATQPYGRDFLNLNLKMIRANDYSFNIQVILNGNPLNCTGGTLRMSAKWQPTDTDVNEVFAVSSPNNGIAFIDATQGTATVTIASGLTNIAAVPFHRVDLPYDIQFTDSFGKRFTVAYGTLTILPNISQTSP